MEIIPAIDILGGRCVRLYQGDYAKETVFDEDPVAVARRWEGHGAPRLHLVDLDGAREGHPVNSPVICAIMAAVSIPVQVGGGIRDLSTLSRYLQLGAQRVVLGTAAAKDQRLLAGALALDAEAVVVAVDVRNGIVMTEGWQKASGHLALELMEGLVGLGVRRFIYTDISRDGTLSEPNFAAIGQVVKTIPVPIIASGGVSRMVHLLTLAELGAEAAIVGRALYTGDLDLAEALAAMAVRQ